MPDGKLWIGLVNNTTWLLALFIIYDISYSLGHKHRLLRQCLNGLLIGLICIGVMVLPYPLFEGVVFDTRSILLSTTALLFGAVPAVIAACAALLFRLVEGGAGTLAGIAVILTSVLIGLAWRRWLWSISRKPWRWLSIYLMSIAVHLAMIGSMLFMQEPLRGQVIRSIALPVMLIYPLAAVLLGTLLLHQQERRQYQEELSLNERKYGQIMENLSDMVWTSDLHWNITFVSPSVKRLLGEGPGEHMLRGITARLSPDSLRNAQRILEEELLREYEPGVSKDRTRVVETELIRADGSTVWTSAHISFLRDAQGTPVGLQGVSRDISQYRQAVKALEEERRMAQLYLDIAPVIFIALDPERNITLINRKGCDLLGLAKDEVLGKNWVDQFVPEELRGEFNETLQRILTGETRTYRNIENSILAKGGVRRLISWYNTILQDDSGKITGLLSAGIDITEQAMTLNALQESERSKSVLLKNLPGMAYRCRYDSNWTMEFVSDGCRELTGYEPESLLHNRDLSFNDLVDPAYRKVLWEKWDRALKLREMFRWEYQIITNGGEYKWVLETGQGVFGRDGTMEALEGIIVDITEAKKRQIELDYISDHDLMTGLYNRRYYEKEKKRLDKAGVVPISILIADINGIRMINNAFGHAEGDRLITETAEIIQSVCREGSLLARTGGDDFTILLPGVDRRKANELMKKLKATFSLAGASLGFMDTQATLSVGIGTKESAEEDLEKAEKEAEEDLHTRKLFEESSHHNALLNSIMTTLYERSQETEEHSQRLSELCTGIAEKLDMLNSQVSEMHLLAMLHDIGKIGIDYQILNKPGKLTEEEWTVMRTHPEIGYRIVLSVPELSRVADYILAHHERWDGKGYPNGTAGEQIPLQSRILAVADAYDAMTKKRAYREALSPEEALQEIGRNAGMQFDPTVATVFEQLMKEWKPWDSAHFKEDITHEK